MEINTTGRVMKVMFPSGDLDGREIIILDASDVKAFVVPRFKLREIKNEEGLRHPCLYFFDRY